MTDAIHARLQLAYPGFELDVDLNLPGTGVTAFFGHSGSGKTTLLRCIAGLENNATGNLEVAGTTWQQGADFLPPHQRPLGYVFQEASLFPHLTARGNLNYALKRADCTQPGMDPGHVIQLLGIGSLLDRYPGQLSGGERQRVAIARALLIRPRLLLMDEPLASLDLPRKLEILPYLEQLRQELALPMIYVSHAPDEVARLADYLVVLDNGHVTCAGPLHEVLSRLDLPIALGEDAGSVIEARVSQRDSRWQLALASFEGGELWLRDRGHGVGEPVRIRVFARDISLSLSPHQDSSIVNILPAVIDDMAEDRHGSLMLARLLIGHTPMVARLTRRSVHHLNLRRGQQVWAQIKSAAIV